jgi:hypothetical protein
MLKHSLPRLGALLALLIVAVLAMPAKPAHALTITVDGNGADWPLAALLFSDVNEAGIIDSRDISDVYFTNNTTNLFWRYDTFASPTNYNLEGLSYPYVILCMDTDNNATTGTNGLQCGQNGVDWAVQISRTAPFGTFSASLFQCNPGCTAAGGVPVATAGNITELAIPLATLGITGPSPACPTGRIIPASIYFDGQTGDPDDSVPGGGTLASNIPCPTPVTLTSLSATRGDAGVELTWSTSSELNIAGYHILRSAAGREAGVRITSALIGGEGSGVSGANYRFTDTSAAVGTSYSYWLEVVNSDGSPEEYGPVRYDPAGTARSFVYLPLVR